MVVELRVRREDHVVHNVLAVGSDNPDEPALEDEDGGAGGNEANEEVLHVHLQLRLILSLVVLLRELVDEGGDDPKGHEEEELRSYPDNAGPGPSLKKRIQVQGNSQLKICACSSVHPYVAQKQNGGGEAEHEEDNWTNGSP